MKRLTSLAAVIALSLALSTLCAFAQESKTEVQGKEDELAPVRAIREKIKAGLGRPIEHLDIDLIMEGADFYGTEPENVRWDSDGSRLWFEWKKWDEEEIGTWEYVLADAGLRRLSEDEAEMVPPAMATWDREHCYALWNVRNNLMFYDGKTKTSRALISGIDGLQPVGFSGDAATALVRMGDNLLAIDLGDGALAIRQLTDIRSGPPQDGEPPAGVSQWFKQQQLELFDTLQRSDSLQERKRQREESLSRKPLWLDKGRVMGFSVSPDLKYLAITQMQENPATRRTSVPSYVTESGYTEDIPSRPKTGDAAQQSQVLILRLADGLAGEVDLGTDRSGAMVFGGEWSPDGQRALLRARSADNKDAWLIAVEPTADDNTAAEGDQNKLALKMTELAHDHDDAWINFGAAFNFGWMPDGGSAWFVSERSGKLHLYTVPAEGGEPQELTKGDYIISRPSLTPDRSAFIFMATIPDPFESQTFLLPLTGGEPEAITSGMGAANAELSPDGTLAAVIASNSNQPWELYVKQTREEGVGTAVTDSPSPSFKSYPWTKPQIIHFTASDGAEVPARLYLPENPDPKHPAVIFVHGAGYLHNVHNWWSDYAHEYCFHHLLMERGYAVLDIDYRGSAGYGREWRTAVYRHMGGKDLDDNVDGARYLAEHQGIDPERIGLYGGSYGGFLTLMALFTAGDHFAAGAALRPVTDWAAYSQWYTASILNTPADDPEAYYKSSPIYFAEGLNDPLLICHGVVDGNVHFQDTVRLAQRLIELRKENWQVAFYPVEDHGFSESSSWADEYRRILKLFEENLKK